MFIGFIATVWTYFSTKKLSKIGLSITLGPVLIFAFVYMYLFLFDLLAFKPNQNDLEGVYHITEDYSGLDKTTLSDLRLELKTDSTFSFTPNPILGLFEHGTYIVNIHILLMNWHSNVSMNLQQHWWIQNCAWHRKCFL
jgi:hypothetical protein